MGHNGFEYVDLGLPSGTLWAACNVGAETPLEGGNYFEWGSTTPWTINDVVNGIHKFVLARGSALCCAFEVTLHDVAHIFMGGDWQMPSIEDVKELYRNVTIHLERILGGIRLQSNRNGKSLFLPFNKLVFDGTFTNSVGGFWTNQRKKVCFYGENFFNPSSDAILTMGLGIRGVLKTYKNTR